MENTDVDLPGTAGELVALIDAATQRLAQVPLLSEDDRDVLDVIDRFETARRRADSVSARLIVEASDRDLPRLAGYRTVHQFLTHGLRLGAAESARRRTTARETGALHNLQGEILEPHLPACAQALTDGAIGATAVDVIARIMDKIPTAVTLDQRAHAEQVLADAARTVSPDDLPMLGHRILAHLDPDGTLTDDTDRARNRGFQLCRQDRQLMSKLRARITPGLRAKLEVILTAWAAPGVNNPDDPDSPFGAADRPDLDPAVLQAAADRDTRTPSQRNHDALEAMCDHILGHGALGRPDKIPAELVITITAGELEARTGTAVTATGTRLPLRDLIDLAADATPWMEVFADHTPAILYFGRGRRLATKTQRLALFGRDRGCTAPGCRTPFAQTQAHHLPSWAEGGLTDIDRLGAACGVHNRREGHGPGQWESTILTHGENAGRVAWRPAGSHGPWQVNPLHHPELLLGHPFHKPPPATVSGRRENSVVEQLLARHIRNHRPPVHPTFPMRT